MLTRPATDRVLDVKGLWAGYGATPAAEHVPAELRDKIINPIVVIAAQRLADLPDTPTVVEVGTTPENRDVLRLYAAGEINSAFQFVYQGGGNLAECIVFGRVAGGNAAAEQPLD